MPAFSSILKSIAVIASCVVIIGALIIKVNAGGEDKSDLFPLDSLEKGTSNSNPQVLGSESEKTSPQGPLGQPVSAAPTEVLTPTSTPTPEPTSTPVNTPTSATTPNPTSVPATPTLTPSPTETVSPTVSPSLTLTPTPTI